eukprot:Clim_evm62s210 gene=Clim_evmTU62s210
MEGLENALGDSSAIAANTDSLSVPESPAAQEAAGSGSGPMRRNRRPRSNTLRGKKLNMHRFSATSMSQGDLGAQGMNVDDLKIRTPPPYVPATVGFDELEAEVYGLAYRYLEQLTNNPERDTDRLLLANEVTASVLANGFGDGSTRMVRRQNSDPRAFEHAETVEKGEDEQEEVVDGHTITTTVMNAMDERLKTTDPDGGLQGLNGTEVPAFAKRFAISHHSEKGRRPTMEDSHVALPSLQQLCPNAPSNVALFGVFDGHGGLEAAEFSRSHFPWILARHVSALADSEIDNEEKIREALHNSFLATDKSFINRSLRDNLKCGSTCVTVTVTEKKLYCAWLGDSQAVLCRNGQPKVLMQAHKPEREDEKARIEAAGGVVVWYGTWRVNGVLSVARSIGDAGMKQFVIGTPDIRCVDLEDGDEFIILACDGLWDVMKYEEVCEFVGDHRKRNASLKGAAEALVNTALEAGSMDNVTVVIVEIVQQST